MTIKKGEHISSSTEIKKGQHLSPKTEFKKGEYFGPNNPNWRGGKSYKIGNGYMMKYAPDHPRACQNRVYEHILVIEKKIGRYLQMEEVCHHINGIKNDNRPENLMVIKNNPNHMSLFHHKPKRKINMVLISRLRKQGYSIPKIAKTIGVHNCLIYRRLKNDE